MLSKQIVDSTVDGFLARGHSVSWSKQPGFTLEYSAGDFSITASEPSHLGYALEMIEKAKKTGFIREILGGWVPVAPKRGVELVGNVSLSLSDHARVIVPSWFGDPKKVEQFVERLFLAGCNTIIVGKGSGERKADFTLPDLEFVYRPTIVGDEIPEVSGTLWLESQIDDPRFIEDDKLTRKERVVLEMKQGIFSPPEELGDFCDLAPKGTTLALSRKSASLLRQRWTPSYTPLCLQLEDLPLFEGHTLGLLYFSENEWDKQDLSLLFRKS